MHQKLQFIDRMRGLAIILVVLVHFSKNFQSDFIIKSALFGQYGVQLFFVASAITLCMSFDRRSNEPAATFNFYVRRYFRIAPLYYCAILGFGILAILTQSSAPRTTSAILANLLFIHGFFPDAINSIVPGGWSIAVEMTFYAIFPLLFRLVDKAWESHGMPVLAGLLALALAASFALQAWHFGTTGSPMANNAFLYFSLPIQFPAFALGMIWYLANYRDQKLSWPAWLDWLGLITLLGACEVILADDLVLLHGLAPALAAAGFFCLANILKRQTGKTDGILVEIGKVSYSIYVLHWPVVWGATGKLIYPLGGSLALELIAFIPVFFLDLALLLILGRLSKRFIEDPGVTLADSLVRRRAVRQPETATTAD